MIGRANNTVSKDIQDKWVRNLSDRGVSDCETSLLCKGLGYAVTCNKVPVVDIITATESAIKQAHLDTGKSEELRQKISSVLRNSKPPHNDICLLTAYQNKHLLTGAKLSKNKQTNYLRTLQTDFLA